MNIILVGLLFLLQFFIFFCFGSLFFHIIHKKVTSFTLTMISGFLLNFSVFEVTAMPFILLKQPLSLLTYSWMFLAGLIILISVISCHREWFKLTVTFSTKIREQSWLSIVLFICIIFQMLLVFTHVDASADASYYVGKVSTDVYTNTLGLYDPYTGNKLSYFNVRYIFSCFPDYNAVFSQFFHIHALKQAKVIMPEIIILVTNMLYYNIGLLLFKNSRKKAAILMIFAFMVNFYSNTIYTSANFLFLRTYEGKSILANIIMTAILYCFLSLYRDYSQVFPKVLLLLVGLSSAAFSSSAMLMVPIAFAAGFFIFVILKRNWKSVGWYILYVLPNLTTGVIYLMHTKGILLFKI